MSIQPFLIAIKKPFNQLARKIVPGAFKGTATKMATSKAAAFRAPLAKQPQFHPPVDRFLRSPAPMAKSTPTRSAYGLPPRPPVTRPLQLSDFPAVPTHPVILPKAPPDRPGIDQLLERFKKVFPNAYDPPEQLEDKIKYIQARALGNKMPAVPTHEVRLGIQRLDYPKAQAGLRELEALGQKSVPLVSATPVKALPLRHTVLINPRTSTVKTRELARPLASQGNGVESFTSPLTRRAPATTLKRSNAPASEAGAVRAPKKEALAPPRKPVAPLAGSATSVALPATKKGCLQALQKLRQTSAHCRKEIDALRTNSDLNPGKKLEMLKLYHEQDRRNIERHKILLRHFYAFL